MFMPKSWQMAQNFSKTPTDEHILQDDALNYRVLNLAGSTFNENNTSYFHKSVGGYHAAKLRRYQEMIEQYIAPQMQTAYREIAGAQGEMDSVDASKFSVLNMLNTRYFIVPINQQGQTSPIYNPFSYGNAWFVNEVEYVSNANEEIAGTGQVDPLTVAIVDNQFKAALKDATLCPDAQDNTIELTTYEPNRLVYEVEAATDGVVVFSEVYYPGWQATIDGQSAPIARADYILRAMYVPAGKHTIEMRFDPPSIHATETIAYIALGIFFLGVVWYIVLYVRRRRQGIAHGQ